MDPLPSCRSRVGRETQAARSEGIEDAARATTCARCSSARTASSTVSSTTASSCSRCSRGTAFWASSTPTKAEREGPRDSAATYLRFPNVHEMGNPNTSPASRLRRVCVASAPSMRRAALASIASTSAVFALAASGGGSATSPAFEAVTSHASPAVITQSGAGARAPAASSGATSGKNVVAKAGSSTRATFACPAFT